MTNPAVFSPAWLQSASEDLRMLGWLQAQERNVAVLRQLYEGGFPYGLSLIPANDEPESTEQSRRMADILQAMCVLSAEEVAALDNDLAADFAAIYLTHARRCSPHESVWLDEDQLMLQGPTFAVREYYRHMGLKVANWRERADDHLCNELEFVAMMLEQHKPEAALGFLQQHVMQWLPLFAQRVAERADTSFYAALALLTLQSCQNCTKVLQDADIVPLTVAAPDPACSATALP